MNPCERLVGAHIGVGGGGRVAYLDENQGQVTYAALYLGMHGYAGMLRERGVPPGTHGMVVADDSVATVVAVLGLWANRCVPVPVSPLLTDAELRFIAEDCRAGFAHLDGPAARQPHLVDVFREVTRYTGDEARALVRGATQNGATQNGATQNGAALSGGVEPARWRPAREVLIQYTSGSTGVPKGVLHGVAGIDAVLAGFGQVLGLRPEDTTMSTAKMSFGYGFGNSLLLPLAARARAVLLNGPVSAHRLSAAVRSHRPTVLFSVPRMFHGLLELAGKGSAPDLRSLRLAVSAGEHLPAELRRGFEDTFGVPLLNGLGATEVLHIVLAARPGMTAPGSTGRPVPGVTVSVRDAHGVPVPDGTDGRLHIAGPTVALGYLSRPEQTSRTFADGGAYTGDVVRRAADGDVRYLCRADDLLNLNGAKVSPLEIETVVRRTPGVADCAVVGDKDAAGLDQAVAYLVAAPDADGEAVRRAVLRALREGLAPFKRPSRVELLDALPTTSTGKLARFSLRTACTSTATAGTAGTVPGGTVPPAAAGTGSTGAAPAAPAGPGTGGGAAGAPTVRVRPAVIRADGDRTLVCVPFAGGSAHAYARLVRCLPPTWRVVTGEASYADGATVPAAADAWWAVVRSELHAGSVLFGHSAGAVIVARLAHRYGPELAGVHVVVSAPPLRLPAEDDADLLASLVGSGLLPADAGGGALTVDEVRRLVAPRFLGDLRMLRGGWRPDPPTTPVHLLVGSADATCDRAEVEGRLTGWPIARVHTVDGGHYFCVEQPDQTAGVLAAIAGV